MALTSTPSEISSEVYAFCKTIARKSTPLFVDVVPAETSKAGECFANVASVIERDGGQRLLGWTIWLRPSVFIEAENHCVWQNDEGAVCDVTPTPDGEKRILFLVDRSASPIKGVARNSRRKALSDDLLVQEYARAGNAWGHAKIMMKRGAQFDRRKMALHRQASELGQRMAERYGHIAVMHGSIQS